MPGSSLPTVSIFQSFNFEMKRYIKQVKLEGFGMVSQEKLTKARVLVIGAGGLGCPAVTYLAAAGIGTLGIIDHDLIEETNLHRQPMYVTSDIGKSKAIVSAERARQLNPDAEIMVWQERINPNNALDIIKDFDLVLDCTDNYEARYLINDACVLLHKPWIYGAVEAWEGQVAVFNAVLKNGIQSPTYRCIFPEASADALSCNDVGVIGTMPGTIGTIQANEAIKLITGVGAIQTGLLMVDLLHNNFQKIQIRRDEEAISKITYLKQDYYPQNDMQAEEISMEQLLQYPADSLIIDIREVGERMEKPFNKASMAVPMLQLMENGFDFSPGKTYILVCASGGRSLATVRTLKLKYPEIPLLSLKGGIQTNAAFLS
jgi:molybdopterin/thiamine biosynthesis adenylyltransferase/rhodanese-related sulfurtransferase